MVIIYDEVDTAREKPVRVCSGHTVAVCVGKYWKSRHILGGD
jgi:hypothetical protein